MNIVEFLSPELIRDYSKIVKEGDIFYKSEDYYLSACISVDGMMLVGLASGNRFNERNIFGESILHICDTDNVQYIGRCAIGLCPISE